MSRIFISYRREDSAGYAGRLYDHLSQYFGEDYIFMDIDSIEPGRDFVEVIEQAVGFCDVLVAVIGKQWLTITDAAGQRRLDNPHDFVRLEIKAALERNICVIPALVREAGMPRSQDLPDDLTRLTRRNALEISDTRFNYDVDRLIGIIENVLSVSKTSSRGAQPASRPISGRLFAGIGASLLVVSIGVLAFLVGQKSGVREIDAEQQAQFGAGLPVEATANTATSLPVPPTDTPMVTSVPQGLASNPLPEAITASDGSPMVLIPAGPFMMGSDSGPISEQPAHEVTLDAFYIDQYEVTNARYANCVATGACSLPGCTTAYNDPDKADHPVVCINWQKADTYCYWRGDRLPTEAEWEKAARGTDGRLWPWGDASPNEALLNFNRNVDDTTPVGSYPDGVSPYGVYDLAGNVFEWVADWYSQDYYATTPSQNPEGPDAGEYKIVRGGSWPDSDRYVRTSYRSLSSPHALNDYSGFRCAAPTP